MNMMKMMKQAQEMQNKLQAMQADMEAREFEGASGGGMVALTITGKGAMVKISIDDSLMDKDEKDMLEDLIVAAHNDAKKKADDAMASAMSDATSGLNLPAGMKLPF